MKTRGAATHRQMREQENRRSRSRQPNASPRHRSRSPLQAPEGLRSSRARAFLVADEDAAQVSQHGSENSESVYGSGSESSVDDMLSDEHVDVDDDNMLDDVAMGNELQAGNELDEIMNKFINDHYGSDKKEDIYGPSVANLLADTINSWCTNMPVKDEIKQAFDRCKVPANIFSLAPVLINEVIYNRLPNKAKDSDKRMKAQNSYCTRAMGPLAAIWDTFVKAEAYCLKQKLSPPCLKLSEAYHRLSISQYTCEGVDSLFVVFHASSVLCECTAFSEEENCTQAIPGPKEFFISGTLQSSGQKTFWG